MQLAASPRSLQIGKAFYTLVLCAAVAFFVVETIHWRWMWDDSIMHYGNFLMDRGMVLYRDIIDMNMPGSYFIEGWAIHVFGGGDLGARLYEFTLLGALVASMVVIAWPYEWFAGLFAGVIFILMHASEGPTNSLQREEVMTVLSMAAYAFAFVSLRRSMAWLMVPFGFLAGLAILLKPTAAPLGFVLLTMAAVELRRRKVAMIPYVVSGLLGLFGALLVVIAFFARTHAFGAFVDIMQRLLPYYSGLHSTYRVMLQGLEARSLIVLLPIALAVMWAHRDWGNWERWALGFGVAFGAFSYFAQHKGYLYHRYPLMGFLLLWIGLEFAWAAHKRGWVRILGLTGFSLGVLYVVPQYAIRVARAPHTTALPDALERDLKRLGGDQLQHKVQCLDMVSGCVTALYRLNLVQSTGFVGDFLLFQPQGRASSTYYQDRFWSNVHATLPTVIVLTNAWFVEKPSFDKLAQWPEFAKFLDSQYVLAVSRDFHEPTEVAGPVAYRIYVLKGSKALTAVGQGEHL